MISAALIIRDDESTLEQCLASLRPHVDELVIVDTGSTDSSPEIAKRYATKFERYTGCNRNPLTGEETDLIWDFADARNKSFSLISPEAEFAFWLDGDDVLVGGENLREFGRSVPLGQSAALIAYEYSYDEAGRCTCVHWRERLLRNPSAWHWTTPCHEVCLPKAGGASPVQCDSVRILHRAQASKKVREPTRNLRILQAYRQRVGESDVRALYYLGVEFARHGMGGAAQQTLRRYQELSGWADEKCLSQLEIARINYETGDCVQAIEWALRAMMTKSWPDPYYLVSRACFRLASELGIDIDQNLRKAAAWAERGQKMRDAQTVLFSNPTERYAIERIANQCYAHFGDLDSAAESCRRGLAGMPGDPELMKTLVQYEGVRIAREVKTGVERLVTCGVVTQERAEAIRGLIDGTIDVAGQPAPGLQVGSLQAIDETTLPAVAEGRLDIVFWVGHQYEPWTPPILEAEGRGGSETMAWEMAKRLAALGHRVRVYGHCSEEQEGVFDGVMFVDAARFHRVTCDALVISRQSEAVDAPGVDAKVRILWVHDVHCGPGMADAARAWRYDEIWCLSEWHRGYFCSVYPQLDPGRVKVTRNGIDLDVFDGGGERSPHRAIYSSSPDRGLGSALRLWPRIRERVPDAELRVFYGFEGLRLAGHAALADRLETMARETAGVVLHGRVAPRELAREFATAGVWFYPTWFSETSCITAMQAHAAGLEIVTSPIAALNETVGIRGRLIAGAPGPIDLSRGFDLAEPSEEYAGAAVEAVIDAFKAAEDGPDEALQEYAREAFGLSALAEDWSGRLLGLVERVTSEVVPKFYCSPEDVANGGDREVA